MDSAFIYSVLIIIALGVYFLIVANHVTRIEKCLEDVNEEIDRLILKEWSED